MFNQIKDLAGGELYLIASLLMFMVFFVIVGIYLLKLNKKHIEVMSQLPIQDNQPNAYEED
ncbi:hypothetical protein SRABI27_05058 [Pedobacter sp. Bi27]|uniref:hypothetical protein n=1 Tax=unclassified Pedobacter TaxID=2628915 RepID=UPI001D5F69B6|nr:MULTISPECIES: hypothetical protein [unclassified Pedobacter]CAH0309169.1 hypothetical protein SRABI36_04946 [Pedobacter sp. Bi36]CAH0315692.1 hypothetical protein SRABI126_04980 [Pedobacter sp. Bi126]CAH0317079.1 hypothetical protein SRABI27_05058 [Pedobacter sp. Bi27]